MDFEQRMAQIKEVIVDSLKDNYLEKSICAYHLGFSATDLNNWRAEVEAYMDVEDGPYFFIFEKKDSDLHFWINETKSRKNSDMHLGAEIPPKG